MAEKKGRKVGRTKDECKAYRSSGRRDINKCKRLAKHLRTHRGDGVARSALEALSMYHKQAMRELAKVGWNGQL